MSVQNNGRPAFKSSLGYCIFEAKKLMIFYGGGYHETMDYRLNENHQPGWFDATDKDGDARRGIYELDGDTLRICMPPGSRGDTDRPVAFQSKAGPRHSLWVLQRE